MINSFRNQLLASISLVLAFSLLMSCENATDLDNTDTFGANAKIKTQVIVSVTDGSGLLISNAKVKIGNKTILSNDKGFAIFKDIYVEPARFVVHAQKNGYLSTLKGIHAKPSSKACYVNLTLLATPAGVTIQSSTGGVVTMNNGATVTFGPNTFADDYGNQYNGAVTVVAYHYSPDDPNFEMMIPGGDLAGLNSSNNPVSLYSYGMANIQLFDPSGNKLNLLSGQTAAVNFPIANSQQANAPISIPLWYLDETNAIWKEDGAATRQGNSYVGNVTHFTTWNCDYQGERATISGKVVDCNNNAVAGIVVSIDGYHTVITDNAGEYTTWVPAGWSITYQVTTYYNPYLTQNSNLVVFTATNSQTNIIPLLTIPCQSRIYGSAVSCSGIPSPAFIYRTSNSGVACTYSVDGTLDFYIPNLEATHIYIENSFGFYDTILPVPSGGYQEFNLGTIMLCSPSGNVYDNSFYMTDTSSLIFNHAFILDPSTTNSGYIDLASIFFDQTGYLANSTTSYYLQGFTTDTIEGSTMVQQLGTGGIAYDDGHYFIGMQSPGDSLVFSLITVGLPGEHIELGFFGRMTCLNHYTGVETQVSITNGRLKFPRLY